MRERGRDRGGREGEIEEGETDREKGGDRGRKLISIRKLSCEPGQVTTVPIYRN